MRRMVLLCLAALLGLTLCACLPAESGAQYTVTRDGVDYAVDWEAGTISDGTYTYPFTFSGSASGYNIKITYPNGSTYSWNMETSNGWGFGGGGGSEDYDPERYAPGDVLCDILEEGAPSERRSSNPVLVPVGIILAGVGLFNVLSPRTSWYLSAGWKFKDAEPSEAAVGIAQVGGVFAVVVGVIMLLAGLLG